MPFDLLGDPVRRRLLEVLATAEHASGEVVDVVRPELGFTQSARRGGRPGAAGTADDAADARPKPRRR